MARSAALAAFTLLLAAGAPAGAQDLARNVTGADAAVFARLRCLGSYDLTPNRLAAERVRQGQGAMRLSFALEGGSLTAQIERQPGIGAWREPDQVRQFEPASRASELFIVKNRLIFKGPGGAAYDLTWGRRRFTGTLDPQDMPQFRHQGRASVRLDCKDRDLP
jgi:hypothetical protein